MLGDRGRASEVRLDHVANEGSSDAVPVREALEIREQKARGSLAHPATASAYPAASR